jgi:hypothetical protein
LSAGEQNDGPLQSQAHQLLQLPPDDKHKGNGRASITTVYVLTKEVVILLSWPASEKKGRASKVVMRDNIKLSRKALLAVTSNCIF